VICADPYYAFRNTLIELYGFRQHPPLMDERPSDGHAWPGAHISERAAVHPTATIGEGAVIHPFAVVDAGASIGANTVLYSGSYVGVDASVGEACVLHPSVTVYDRCVLGDRVILHSSTVVGQDGFGYATHAGEHHKIPQTGIVVIEDDVELGAGCAIERAAMGETRIGKGAKFADLISIGHGTSVGDHCLFVSLVGVSGSVDVGRYVVLGGQVGVTGHLTIGDGVQAAGKTAITSDIAPGRRLGGQPAVDIDQAKRNVLVGRDLYGLAKRVRQLERELAKLKGERPPTEGETGSGNPPPSEAG
jgi:UDP-3-O-[3-hydroxymyristoyl] glucosamine N-acyltransferase